MANDPDVTQILQRWQGGDQGAADELLRAVYPEMRRIAARHLRGERAGHSLQPTALAHEVYLRLVDQRRANWQNRAHFLAVAARLARRILVDHARRRIALKRGLGAVPIHLDDIEVAAQPTDSTDLVGLDEALERLGEIDARGAQVIELRFFGGLTVEETAAALNVSTGTVKRDWLAARLWLLEQLHER